MLLKSSLVLLICMLFTYADSKGQTKFEREYRINTDEVPKEALTFIKLCFPENSIKWYTEESQDGKTIEAKTRYQNNKYSIEFDLLGNVLDVERTIRFKTLSPIIAKNISTSLDSIFLKYKIIKTQIQWKGDKDVILQLVQKSNIQGDYQLQYELIVKGKKEKGYQSYEVLLSKNGKIIKVLPIVQRNSDNIEF
ncbi:hypothetical protein [Aquimarina sp. MMG016]|uniref:hypothetical protein n=1 Tax=Aquimarina sp. MMG016 TaxID=2822690 RepID=UPI001B3A7A01|nr:hypothetical protein [Aquimarina sp. MMG016]MBQ4822734.1 hypothetical protein [Aquimarina sp. MMG016]